jgi:hypothetical protein
MEAPYLTLGRAITMKTNLSLWLVATVVLTGMVLDLSWAQTAPLDPNTPASVPSNRVLARALEIEAGPVKFLVIAPKTHDVDLSHSGRAKIATMRISTSPRIIV